MVTGGRLMEMQPFRIHIYPTYIIIYMQLFHPSPSFPRWTGQFLLSRTEGLKVGGSGTDVCLHLCEVLRRWNQNLTPQSAERQRNRAVTESRGVTDNTPASHCRRCFNRAGPSLTLLVCNTVTSLLWCHFRATLNSCFNFPLKPRPVCRHSLLNAAPWWLLSTFPVWR